MSYLQWPIISGITNIRARPDKRGATTDAGADKGYPNYCSREREKMMRAWQEQTKPQAKPETGTNVRGQSNVKGRAQEINRNQATRSTTSDKRRNHKSDHDDG